MGVKEKAKGDVWNRTMYELGTEITFTYFVKEKDLSIQLKEGDNTSPELENEVIHLRKLQSAYMVTTKINSNDIDLKGSERAVRLDFAPHLNYSELPEIVRFHVTSEPNAFGIESGLHLEGDSYEVDVEKNLRNPQTIG